MFFFPYEKGFIFKIQFSGCLCGSLYIQVFMKIKFRLFGEHIHFFSMKYSLQNFIIRTSSILPLVFLWLGADKVYPKQGQHDNTQGLPKGYHCFFGQKHPQFLTNPPRTS